MHRGLAARSIEVLSAGYLLASLEQSNLAGDVPLLVQGNDFGNTAAAVKTYSSIDLPAALRWASGRRMVGLEVSANTALNPGAHPGAGYVSLMASSGGRVTLYDVVAQGLSARIVAFANSEGRAWVRRAIAQALLIAGVRTVAFPIGDNRISDDAEDPALPSALQNDGLAGLLVGASATENLQAFHGWQLIGAAPRSENDYVAHGAAELVRLARGAGALFATASRGDGDDGALARWQKVADRLETLLDVIAFLRRPASDAQLRQAAHEFPVWTSRRARSVAASLPDRLQVLELNFGAQLAAVQNRLGNTDDALAQQRLVAMGFQGLRDAEKTIHAWTELAAMAQAVRRFDVASDALKRCQDFAIVASLSSEAAKCLSQLGTVRRSAGDPEGARDAYSAAIEIYQNTDSPLARHPIRLLGLLFEGVLRDYPKAAERFAASEELARQEGDAAMVWDLRLDRARLALYRGEYARAVVLSAEVEREADRWLLGDYGQDSAKQQTPDEMAIQRREIATLVLGSRLARARAYWYLADFVKAREVVNGVLGSAARHDNVFVRIQALSLLGLIELKTGHLESASEVLRNALELARGTGRDSEVASSLNYLGVVLREAGHFALARNAFREALGIDRRRRDDSGLAYDYRNLGVLRLRRGDATGAVEFLQRALAGSRQVGERYNEAQAGLQLGRALWLLGNTVAAAVALQDAQLVADEIGLTEVAWRTRYYLATIARARGDFVVAREVGSRAVSLVASQPRGGDLSEVRAERDSLAEMVLELALTDSDHVEAVRLIGLFGDVGMVFGESRQRSLMAILGRDAVLLRYLLLRDSAFVAVISGAGVEVVRLPMGGDEIEAAVSRLADQMAVFAPVDVVVRALSRTLVSPVARRLRGTAKTLVLVADEAVSGLPFALLETEPDSADGSQLVDRFDIARVAGMGAALRLLSQDPNPRSLGATVVAVAPPSEQPFAELEVRALNASRVLTGRAATVSGLWDMVEETRPDVVSIAAHGSVDERGAGQLFFAGKSGEATVSAVELAALPRLAPLVVVSACFGADGDGSLHRRGAVFGLARGLRQSGVRTVIAAHGRVSDLSAAVLVKRFFRELRRVAPGVALGRAMRQTRARFSHPAHWASFSLLGDYR